MTDDTCIHGVSVYEPCDQCSKATVPRAIINEADEIIRRVPPDPEVERLWDGVKRELYREHDRRATPRQDPKPKRDPE